MNDGNNHETNWIAVDWGTSALRVWAMSANGTVIERGDSDRGMSVLAPAEFEPSLRVLIDEFLPDNQELPIVACGMVGAQNGWIEASYQSVQSFLYCSQLFSISVIYALYRFTLNPCVDNEANYPWSTIYDIATDDEVIFVKRSCHW